jgi:hypothetical protein
MDDALKEFIQKCIHDTLFELFSVEFPATQRSRDLPPSVRLEASLDRLEFVVARLQAMSATGGWGKSCGYNATDIASILNHVVAIDGRVP